MNSCAFKGRYPVRLFFALFFMFISSYCFSQNGGIAAAPDTFVIYTNMGTMKAVLYDDTPVHSAHYKELAGLKYFDGTLFTRVVKDFIIQGGALDSRNAPAGARVGGGSDAYLLKPEFRKKHIAKYGVLGAPRESGKMNPEKKSDGSQFFIVKGKVYTEGFLDSMQMKVNNPLKNKWWSKNVNPHASELNFLRMSNVKAYNNRIRDYKKQMYSELKKNPTFLYFTKEQRKILTTKGGAITLDGEYTFFGELVDGFDVLDMISDLKTDKNERPFKDVVMKVRYKKAD